MWRLRSIIQTEVAIPAGITESKKTAFKVFAVDKTNTQNSNDVPENIRYCDVVSKTNIDDIFNAYAYLYEELNAFLDRYSMVSYGKATILEIRSICPDVVKVGDKFDLAIPQYAKSRKTLPVQGNSLVLNTEFQPDQQRWLRIFRSGMNSTSEEEKFLNYYVLLEEIAQKESEEYVMNKCRKCGEEVNSGRKATNNFIMNILKNHGLDDNKLRKRAPELRNVIAHGGKKKDKNFLVDIMHIGSYMEEACLLEMEKRLEGIKVVNRLNCHIIDIPMVKHKCKCKNDGSFELIESTQTIPARFVNLNGKLEGQSAMFGFATNSDGSPVIDPFSWPNIQE